MARISRGKHHHQTALGNDGSKDISANVWNETGGTPAHDESGMLGLPRTTIVMASNAVVPTDTGTIAQASGSPGTDTIKNITNTNTSDGDTLYLWGNSADTININHNDSGSGNIFLLGAVNKVLSSTVPMKLVRFGANWYEDTLSGGIVNANVSSSAAIAYSKLNLTTSILNADIANSAAIAPSKINGTAAILGVNTFTGQQTISTSTNTGLVINPPSAPTGSGSEFIGAISKTSGTIAFSTTAQTGDFESDKLDKATLTNPSSGTIPNASTLKIVGGPVAGSNVTITNKYALWVAGDNVRVDGNIGEMISPSYGLHLLGGQSRNQALATPSAPVITNVGTTGSTTYTYFIVAIDKNGNKTLASSSGQTTTGNATLNGTNYNTVTWTAVSGAVSYDVLKTDTAHSVTLATTALSYNDQGGASSGYTAPTRNTTADGIFDGDIKFNTSGTGIIDANGNNLVTYTATGSAVNYLTFVNSATGNAFQWQLAGTDSNISGKFVPKGTGVVFGAAETMMIPMSDESTTAITTTGTKVTIYMPWAGSIAAVYQSANTAPTTSAITLDVLNNAGSSIFSTKPTIAAAANTGSNGVLTITPTTFAQGDKIQFQVNTVDTGQTTKGLKMYLVVYRTS